MVIFCNCVGLWSFHKFKAKQCHYHFKQKNLFLDSCEMGYMFVNLFSIKGKYLKAQFSTFFRFISFSLGPKKKILYLDGLLILDAIIKYFSNYIPLSNQRGFAITAQVDRAIQNLLILNGL